MSVASTAAATSPGSQPSVPDDIASPWRYLRPDASGVNADFLAASRIAIPSQPDPRRNEGFTSVLAIPRDGIWQGTSALVQLGDGPAATAVIVPKVWMHVKVGTSGGFSSRRYPNSLMGVFAVLRQSLLRAQQYREAIRLYDENGRRGVARPAFDAVSNALILCWNSSEKRSARRISSAELAVKTTGSGPPSIAMTPPQGANLPVNNSDRMAAESNPGKLEKAGVRFALVTNGSDRTDRIWDAWRLQLRTD